MWSAAFGWIRLGVGKRGAPASTCARVSPVHRWLQGALNRLRRKEPADRPTDGRISECVNEIPISDVDP